MASLQPVCNTKKFSNRYYLTVRTEYDTNFICCEKERPVCRMEMNIMPMCNPECFGFVPELGFVPREIGGGLVNLDLIEKL